MALMATLSFSFYSIAPAKLQASPSLSQSHNKNPLFSTLQQPPSVNLDDSSNGRRLPVQLRGKISPVARSAPIAAAMKKEPLRIIISGAPASGKGTQCELITKKIAAAMKKEPLRIIISGAPASGKGTQCELITKKYGLVHIAAGDLLRAEVAAGTENGKRAKEYMEKGMLVPDEIVVMMVKERLLQPDAQGNGWLLDGYPRSLSQAKALEDLGIRPDLFILLDVSEDILVERVVGRRLDPVTGKIYHLKYSPPENEEIAARLTQRFDDTEEKVKLRLQTHHKNVVAVLSVYEDIICKVNGNAPKEDVFSDIDNALSSVLEKKSKLDSASVAAGMAS